jgi:hypothetical protein
MLQLFTVWLFQSSGHYKHTSKTFTNDLHYFNWWNQKIPFLKILYKISESTCDIITYHKFQEDAHLSLFYPFSLTALEMYKKYKHVRLLWIQRHLLLANITQYDYKNNKLNSLKLEVFLLLHNIVTPLREWIHHFMRCTINKLLLELMVPQTTRSHSTDVCKDMPTKIHTKRWHCIF